MRKSAQTEQDVLPIVGQCLEGIQRCTDSINEKEVRSESYICVPYGLICINRSLTLNE